MFKRTRAEGIFAVALLIGSTVAAVGFMAAEANSLAEFVSEFRLLSIFGLGMAGVLFGLVPYIGVAIPACLVLERRGFGVFARTAILVVGGTALGTAVSLLTIDTLAGWAAMVGGCTGLALGVLRREIHVS